MTIHKTAVIDSRAQIHPQATIDPFVVIDGEVTIDEGTVVGSHTVLSGKTTIGRDNVIGSFASIGTPPQDINYKGEDTELIIGDGNQIREYVSIHRGTVGGGGKTVIGNGNMIMAYCHIAHDCIIADKVIMANVATLAGHVEVGSNVNIGGLSAVHQFCRLGEYSYVGGMTGIGMDVPPYVIVTGVRNRMRVTGINKIGLRRNGFAPEVIAHLEKAFKIIFRTTGLLTEEALQKTMKDVPACSEVARLVDFFKDSKRGVVRRTDRNLK